MVKYVRAKVCGEVAIRDVLTRESVQPGGEVTLLVREPGESLPRCERHPRGGKPNPKAPCLCVGTQIDALVESGAISDVKPYEKTEPKPATEKR